MSLRLVHVTVPRHARSDGRGHSTDYDDQTVGAATATSRRSGVGVWGSLRNRNLGDGGTDNGSDGADGAGGAGGEGGLTGAHDESSSSCEPLRDKLLEYLRGHDFAHGCTLFTGPWHTLIIFRCGQKHLSGIMRGLDTLGVPSVAGRIDIMSVLATKPALPRGKTTQRRTKWDKLRGDRMTTEEIYGSLDNGNHLTCA
jgi:hypothetical protein